MWRIDAFINGSTAFLLFVSYKRYIKEAFMRRFNHMIVITIFLLALLPATSFCKPPKEHVVYNGKELTLGYDIGVNSSGGMHSWLKDEGNELVMSYPNGQKWGAVFITVGKAKRSSQERQAKNFSNFDTLIISMKGDKGGERVDIGIKDKNDPDNGSETKKSVMLTNKYSEYRFPLKEFRTADLQNLYVVTEFVFRKNSPCSVYVNSVKFQ
jgi:hypothetical protein